MNIRRLWVKLALLLTAVFTAGFAIPGTVAYLWAKSGTLVNHFTAPSIQPDVPVIPLPPATGDAAPLGVYVLLLALSCAGMVLLRMAFLKFVRDE